MYYLGDIKGQKEAKEAMEYHYNELRKADNTFDRKEHFAIMKKLYDKYNCIRKIWDYIETAKHYINRFIKKITELIANEKHDYFYIMLFRKWTNKQDYFYKIGSYVHPDQRLKEHEGNYCGYSGEILITFDTKDMAASSLEDKVRSYFIRKYGEENHIPKDRFTCEIDLEDIKKKLPACYKALRAAEIY